MTKRKAQKIATQAVLDGWRLSGYRRDGKAWGIDLVDPVSGYPVHFWDADHYTNKMEQIRRDREDINDKLDGLS